MYGVIDIGSNTIRLNVYKLMDDNFKLLFKNKFYAGLAGYVVDGRLSMEGIQKASSVLYDYKRTLDNLDIKDLLAFATASLRNIRNSQEARLLIEKLTGVRIEVLSGEEEGLLGYKGAMFDVNLNEGVVVDIGGSSTELVAIQDGKVIKTRSFPMGGLNMYLKNVEQILPQKEETKRMRKFAMSVLSEETMNPPGDTSVICGVGGSMRSLRMINNSIHGHPLFHKTIEKEEFDEILSRLTNDSMFAREKLIKTCPERIHTMIPSLCIMKSVIKALNAKKIIVSDYGVREGYLYSRVIQQRGETDGETL